MKSILSFRGVTNPWNYGPRNLRNPRNLWNLTKIRRVWKGFCVIRDSAEIERVIREYRKLLLNPAVIREFYIGCDAGFSFSVVRDS